ANDQPAQRVRSAFEVHLRQAAGRHHAEGVAVPARVLGGDQPLLAREPDEQRAALPEQRLRQLLVVFTRTKIAAETKDVVQLVGRARRTAQLCLHLFERSHVDQLAQVLLTEQLAQEVAVER